MLGSRKVKNDLSQSLRLTLTFIEIPHGRDLFNTHTLV